MANYEAPTAGEQSGTTSEYVLGSTQQTSHAPIMERFRRALNATIVTFRSDLPSEDFLSPRILELSESSSSIDQFFCESIAFMDQHVAEHRRQAETMRASLRAIQAFFTSFDPAAVDIQQPQPPGSAQSIPSSSRLFRAAPRSTVNPSRLPMSSESSPHVLGSPFVLTAPSRRSTHSALPDSSQASHILRETREDISMDALQYFEGPLSSTPPLTPASNEGDPPSAGNSPGGRPHPFVLRQIIRRHHLIRTPDGRVNISGSIPSSRNNTPSGVRVRFRSVEFNPYQTPRRSSRRLALAKAKGKGKSVDRSGRNEETDG